MKQTLTYIKHKYIDIEKYDACITKAINSRVYAYSWYLDIVADNWDVLVMGDYEVVMPIPFLRLKRNIFAKKIYQPDFCQQLGVFSQFALNKEIVELFYNYFLTLRPRAYNFNSNNSQHFFKDNSELKERINYELVLNKSYEELFANFSTNRKRNLKKSYKASLHISDDISVNEFVSFKEEQTNYKSNASLNKKMNRLIVEAINKNKGKLYGVYKSNLLVAGVFVLKEKRRLTTLISATNNIGKKNGAIAFLVDTIIKENSNTDIIFDFEGSMIPGIARFYKSFGAEKKVYKMYQK